MGDRVTTLDLDLGTILATNTQKGTDDSVLTSITTQVMIKNAEEHQRVHTGGKGSRLSNVSDGGSGASNGVHSWQGQVQGRGVVHHDEVVRRGAGCEWKNAKKAHTQDDV
jgi:hypothetical protein